MPASLPSPITTQCRSAAHQHSGLPSTTTTYAAVPPAPLLLPVNAGEPHHHEPAFLPAPPCASHLLLIPWIRRASPCWLAPPQPASITPNPTVIRPSTISAFPHLPRPTTSRLFFLRPCCCSVNPAVSRRRPCFTNIGVLQAFSSHPQVLRAPSILLRSRPSSSKIREQ